MLTLVESGKQLLLQRQQPVVAVVAADVQSWQPYTVPSERELDRIHCQEREMLERGRGFEEPGKEMMDWMRKGQTVVRDDRQTGMHEETSFLPGKGCCCGWREREGEEEGDHEQHPSQRGRKESETSTGKPKDGDVDDAGEGEKKHGKTRRRKRKEMEEQEDQIERCSLTLESQVLMRRMTKREGRAGDEDEGDESEDA